MKKINRMCSFYVNDWHLTVMILPYIKEKIESKEKITIISEENLEENIKTILERLNIKKEEKEKISQIGWSKTSTEKIKQKIDKENKINNIIIIGNEGYIEKANKIIENKAETGEINIVDCYEVMRFNNNMEKILKNYKKIINTSGEKTVEEAFAGLSKEVI